MSNVLVSHQIAGEAAKLIIERGTEAGLPWSDIAVALETTVVAVVIACAALSKTPKPAAFIQEIIDTVTERAHVRAIDYFQQLRDA